MKQNKITEILALVAASIILIISLYLLKEVNYLLFHSTIEIFSIVVAFSIFVLAWNSRKYLDCDFFTFLGTGYLFMSFIDILHTLTYKGMGIFPDIETNIATQLWIAARYFQSITLLISVFIIGKRVRMSYFFVIYSVLIAVLFFDLFYKNYFPDCFVEGQGLTPFKVISEYVISFFFLLGAYLLFRKREHFSKTVSSNLIVSSVILIFSEISFTLYSDPYGFFNILGHYLKLFSFYLIYRAVIETGIKKPFELLFKDIKQKETKYYGMLQDQTEMICRTLAGGTIIFVNDAYSHYFGKKSEELVGKTFMPLVYEEDKQIVQKAIEKLSNKNPVESHEQRVILPGGRIRWNRWTNRAIFDNKGSIIEIQSVGRDVTERKETEEQLKKSEELFRTVLDTSPISVSTQDRKLRYTWMYNPQSGFSVKDAMGKTDAGLFDKDTAEKVIKLKNSVISSGKKARMEIVVLKPDRKVFDTIIDPLRDGNGSIIGVTTVAIDISEHKKTEFQLERLSSFPELNPNPVLEIDVNGKITYANPGAKQLLSNAESVDKQDQFLQDWEHIIKYFKDTSHKNFSRDIKVNDKWYYQLLYYLPEIRSIRVYAIEITENKKYSELLKESYADLEKKIAERTIDLTKINDKLNNEIMERKNREKHIYYRNVLQESIVKLASRNEFLNKTIDTISEICGCSNAGIRILSEDGKIEYNAHAGFNDELWESESHLCIKEGGCICTRIMAGKPAASDEKAMSEYGSFYSNNYFEFVKGLSTSDKKNNGDVCVIKGFASVAVIPIRDHGKITGTIHIASEENDKIPYKEIESIELLNTLITAGMRRYDLMDRLKNASTYSRNLIETSLDPLVTISRDGKIMDVNKATELATGISREKLIGTSFLNYFTEPDKAMEGYNEVFTKGFVRDYPLTIRHASGRLIDVLYNAAVYKNEKGEIEGVFAAARDITKHKETEKKLAEIQLELVESKRLSDIGTLAATVAHELRNPLAAIRIAIYNVKRKAKNEALDKNIWNIEKKIEESNNIINNLLFYSRIRMPQLENVKIIEILKECIDMAKKRYTKKKAKYIFDGSPIGNLSVLADPLQMNELFNNVLNNAYDAIPDNKGEIKVEAAVNYGFVKISIKDNGSGIEKENMKKIFDPFFTTKARGTGLGLAVCNQIAYLHGGKIELESEVKKGTTVNITLPIAGRRA